MGDRIVLGGDHRGFPLKRELARRLAEAGFEVSDFGPPSDAAVDYPDFAAPAAREVSEGRSPRGIVICGSGLGVMYTANRFANVRAALVHDVETAIAARQHNDANVLALAGDRTDPETAWKIVRTWLETPFEGGRHVRRVEKIDSLTRPSEAPSDLAQADPETLELMRRGAREAALELDLRPDASLPSAAVLEVLRSPQAEGSALAAEALRLAEARASERFGAAADLRVASGKAARAHLVTLLLEPGDTLLAIGEPSDAPIGIRAIAVPVDPETGRVDLEVLRGLARREGPKLLLADARDLVRWPDWKALRGIADEVGAAFAVDLGGAAGLVAAGALPSPVGTAAAVAGATDGTLRGPRGGFVLIGAALRDATLSVAPRLPEPPPMRDLLARAVALRAAGTPEFRAYAVRALAAARALADALGQGGLLIGSGATETHRVEAIVPKGGDALALAAALARAGIHGAAPSPARLSFGTAAVAARGIGAAELAELLRGLDLQALDVDAARARVEALCRRFPIGDA